MYSTIKKLILNHKLGFTLVELIIAITILSILSAVGIQSFMSYLEAARDTTRITDLNNISNFLEEYWKINWNYPKPDNANTFYYQNTNTSPVWYQWIIGDSTSLSLRLVKTPMDPMYQNTYYSYSITSNWKQFELWWVYEASQILFSPTISDTYADTATFPAIAILLGNYNKLFVSTTSSTWNILLISSPSITQSNFDNLDLSSSTFWTGSFVLNWKNNIPASYNKNPLIVSNNFYVPSPVLSLNFTWSLSNIQVILQMEAIKTIYSPNILLNSNSSIWNKVSTMTAWSTDQINLWMNIISWLIEWSYNMKKSVTSFSINPSSISTSPSTNSIISHNCLISPTLYISSNPSVASISWTWIIAISTWTTIISAVWWNCTNSSTQTLKVN